MMDYQLIKLNQQAAMVEGEGTISIIITMTMFFLSVSLLFIESLISTDNKSIIDRENTI